MITLLVVFIKSMLFWDCLVSSCVTIVISMVTSLSTWVCTFYCVFCFGLFLLPVESFCQSYNTYCLCRIYYKRIQRRYQVWFYDINQFFARRNRKLWLSSVQKESRLGISLPRLGLRKIFQSDFIVFGDSFELS